MAEPSASAPAGPRPAADPLAWLDGALLAAFGAAVDGADLGDDDLHGSLALVVPAASGRPRRSRSSPGSQAGAGPTAVQGHLRIQAGRVVAWQAGEAPADAVATLTLAAADARAALEGAEEPSVLFMQGRLKADGDMRVVLAVLRATACTHYVQERGILLKRLAL